MHTLWCWFRSCRVHVLMWQVTCVTWKLWTWFSLQSRLLLRLPYACKLQCQQFRGRWNPAIAFYQRVDGHSHDMEHPMHAHSRTAPATSEPVLPAHAYAPPLQTHISPVRLRVGTSQNCDRELAVAAAVGFRAEGESRGEAPEWAFDLARSGHALGCCSCRVHVMMWLQRWAWTATVN